MDHPTQVRIIEDLLDKLERRGTHDAGTQVLNPAAVYIDPDLAAREWQVFFREHPQLIGMTGDLPEPGDYFAMDDFGVPLIATRDSEGRFRAYINACRHRGTRVTDGDRGNAKRFTCPFHGWTYNVDGKLVGIPEVEHFGEVDRLCNSLLELPAVEQYGMLWVHPQPGGAIDVDTILGELAPEIARWHCEDRVYRGGCTLEKRMNWKLANDTFGETYHFARLHRKTLNNLFHGDLLSCEAYGRNHRAVFPNLSLGTLKEKPKDKWFLDRVGTILYFLFPNIQVVMSDRQITLFRIYPTGADPTHSVTKMSHYFSAEALGLIEGGEKTVIGRGNVYDMSARNGNAIVSPEAAMEILDSTVEQEDFQMGESTQRTIESGLVPHLIFGRNEAPLHHFHNTFRAALDLPPLEQVGQKKAQVT